MGDVKGFLKIKRAAAQYRPVCERIKDYQEVALLPHEQHSKEQASRCMDCGTPFCNWGCPIGNYIPEWNDLVFRGLWRRALELLSATNNFPEITGRLCPAPCEFACVLGINDDPVTIRENELAIIEYGFKKGSIRPMAPKKRTGKKIAIVGSGPAGLACADQLNKAGHNVTVFEKDDKPGGILRYGIPDFKLEKWVLDRRIKILEKEGIGFKTGVNVGSSGRLSLQKDFDAVCLAGGCRVPRDLRIDGRNLDGIHFAMEYLTNANKKYFTLSAKNKKVVVIGGGDTGADCVGVANRQGADCVVQIELMPQPPECRPKEQPWPKYPMLLKTSTSHEEGAQRKWSILTKKFIGEKGHVKKIGCVQVEFSKDDKGCPIMQEIPGSGFEMETDMVILALGFVHPEKNGLLDKLGVEFDQRGNVKTNENYMTSVKNVFSAGDMHRGQSLVVWAILEGRWAAYHIDKNLMGKTTLPKI
ncbi:MAG: glutamate synthase subunit beta [Candidatus Omnitrophica bacterium]|nr:glutamate synthase subunit beta [Candidatus Omnitrophota bacterium]